MLLFLAAFSRTDQGAKPSPSVLVCAEGDFCLEVDVDYLSLDFKRTNQQCLSKSTAEVVALLMVPLVLLACSSSPTFEELPDESTAYLDCVFASLETRFGLMGRITNYTSTEHIVEMLSADAKCIELAPEYKFKTQADWSSCWRKSTVYIWDSYDQMALNLEEKHSKSEIAHLRHLRDQMTVLSDSACYPLNDIKALPLE